MTDTSRELAIFNFQGRNIRTLESDGEPWFYAIDVCRVLGLTNVARAVSGLDEDEADLTTSKVRSSNGVEQSREMHIVSEPGLYHLVFKSRMPEAVAFRRWIRHEVIPSIRKTGKYVAPDHIRQMLGLELERLDIEAEADQERWRAEELQQQLNNVLADRDRWRREAYARRCRHPKNESDGSCVHGRACSFVG